MSLKLRPLLSCAILSFSILRIVAAIDNAEIACEMVLHTLGIQKIVNSSSTEYMNDVQFNWSKTCWIKPHCIVKVSTASDVASVIKVVDQYQVPFAVRSGGHNPNRGFASVNGSGILLDLSALNNISLSRDRTTAIIGAGATWGQVYNELNASGLSVVGTKEPFPGVGGSILGGGDPLFPSLHGLACDNVQSFEVVLSNGSIVKASAFQYPELFKALKGGGSNLGILTSLQLFTRPPVNTWSNFVMYDSSQNPALLDAYEDFQNKAENNERSNIIFNLAGNVTVVGFIFADHVSSLPPVFSRFNGIPQLSVVSPPTNMTLAGLSNLLGLLTPASPARRAIYGLSSKVNRDTYRQALTSYNAALKSLGSVDSAASLLLTFQPLGSRAVSRGAANGGNLLGLSQEPQTWYALQATYSSASSDAAIEAINAELAASISSASVEHRSALSFLFLNDLAAQQNPFPTYGAANEATLKSATIKYDPKGIFQNLQNGGFLVAKTRAEA